MLGLGPRGREFKSRYPDKNKYNMSITLCGKFKEDVISKYKEMKKSNKTEDVINDKVKLVLFINKEPRIVLTKFIYNSDILYIGTN